MALMATKMEQKKFRRYRQDVLKRPFGGAGSVPLSKWMREAFPDGTSVRDDAMFVSLGNAAPVEIVADKSMKKDGEAGALSTPDSIMDFIGVMTTDSRDRDSDILRTDGAIVDPKMPLLFQHNWDVAIGKLVKIVDQTSSQLRGLFTIVDSELGQYVARMTRSGVFRLSIGFRPIDYDRLTDDNGNDIGGWDIKRFMVYECSVVSIPSNVDAEIVEWKQKGLSFAGSGKSATDYYAKQAVKKSVFFTPIEKLAAEAVSRLPKNAQDGSYALELVKSLTQLAKEVGGNMVVKTAPAGTKADDDEKPKEDEKPKDGEEKPKEDEKPKEEEGKKKASKTGEKIAGWGTDLEKLAGNLGEENGEEIKARLTLAASIFKDASAGYTAGLEEVKAGCEADDIRAIVAGTVSALGETASRMVSACEELEALMAVEGIDESIASAVAGVTQDVIGEAESWMELVTMAAGDLTAMLGTDDEEGDVDGDGDGSGRAADAPTVDDNPDETANRFIGQYLLFPKKLKKSTRQALSEVLAG